MMFSWVSGMKHMGWGHWVKKTLEKSGQVGLRISLEIWIKPCKEAVPSHFFPLSFHDIIHSIMGSFSYPVMLMK